MRIATVMIGLTLGLASCGGEPEPPPSVTSEPAPTRPAPSDPATPSEAPVPSEPSAAEPAAPACPPDLPPDPDRLGWPDEPEALVAHLNQWNRDELELIADPASHPDQAPAGESNGWVTQHEEQLAAMGVAIAWNPTDRCFGIVDGAAPR